MRVVQDALVTAERELEAALPGQGCSSVAGGAGRIVCHLWRMLGGRGRTQGCLAGYRLALGLLLGIIGRIIVGVMRESRTVQSNWAGAVGTDAADAPRVQHR